jgi:hypothetical protein
VRKFKEEERKMKVYKFNRQDRWFAPLATPCVLSLIMAIFFLAPSVVFARSAVLNQECEFALVNTEHVITATVTEEDGTPAAGVDVLFAIGGEITNANPYTYKDVTTDPDGIAVFSYTGSVTGTDKTDKIELVELPNWDPFLGSISTTWTDNEADLCSDSPGVTVGSRVTLNAKKKGALRIAVCAVDGSDVSNVDPDSVLLVGVKPWHWKHKDSSLCPDGKDGVKDLVLKFKNREVVEALEESMGELADGDPVTLALTGTNDGKAFDVKWKATIKKKGKRHWKKNHHQDHNNGKGKGSKK